MNYKVWITITITHGFYHSENCGVVLKETERSALLIKKAGLLFRRQSPVKWVLLKNETEKGMTNHTDLILKEGNFTLDFNLIPDTAVFYYFTDLKKQSVEGDGWVLQTSKNGYTDKINLRIAVTPGLSDNTKDIRINIPNRNAFWEFILIPKHSQVAEPPVLRENTGKLNFSAPEKIRLPGEVEAYRCVTETQVPMKKVYDSRISLWIKREKGEMLLSNRIPLPQPDSVSVINPQEMITTYFYF